jgi:hypothetical protein
MSLGLATPDLLADDAFGAWYAGNGAASSDGAGGGPSTAPAEAVQTNAMRHRPMKLLPALLGRGFAADGRLVPDGEDVRRYVFLAMTTSEFAGTRTTVGVA